MKSLIICVVVFVAVVGVVQVQCSLPVEKTCGDTNCPAHHYCSPIDHQCRPCIQTCSSNSSNYDHARCEKGCQDYLHDKLYVRRNESSTNYLEFATKDDIESLRTLLIILLVVAIPTFILVLGLAFAFLHFFLRRGGKINEKKNTIALPIIYDNKYGKEKESLENMNNNKRRSIKLEREPSESTLPDYSYDNPNMSHSPVHPV